MSSAHFRSPYSFYGHEKQAYASSRVVILPVPFEGTVSYRRGTSEGPHAVLTASRQVELYDSELGCTVPDIGIHTMLELEPSADSTRATLDAVREVTELNLKKSKFQIMIGGEHSITLGAVEACASRYRNLSILQLDAHTDLRDSYEGSPYNHACVMRRCLDLVPNIVQVGIRSQDEEEANLVRTSHRTQDVFYAPELPIKEILSRLTGQVYVTIDVDVFDPSVMSSTGTPEPGGFDWYGVTSLLRAVAKSATIVGADVVELAPIPGNVAPDFTVAKLVHKLIMYRFAQRRRTTQ